MPTSGRPFGFFPLDLILPFVCELGLKIGMSSPQDTAEHSVKRWRENRGYQCSDFGVQADALLVFVLVNDIA
ncbi:hypothetical protein jaqu_40470 [Jannaschia aquimarina]|uniref:Uncharacterized protein n=1 Tax=Jannaschia aquimarina TaxID=935700 RepID=A0A0D1D2B2_9RHOB|nr:hypothetical protein jaqu_40470 [Jannaschia aquimarina]SNS49293.1 hypothetical protein SAMN05421775_101167 [Jannaschia aquimarina]